MLSEQDYWAEVRSIAGGCLAVAVRDGEVVDSESLHDWLWQTLDSHEFVIYTAKAQAVLAISPNDGAMIEEFGAEGVAEGGSLQWSRLAYCAMEADVRDALPDVDWDDDEERAEWLAEFEGESDD